MTHPQTAALKALLERVEAGSGHYDVLVAANDWALSIGKSGLYACVMDAYHGSLDAAKALVEAVCPGAHQVNVDWGPSGCGAKLFWWPDGLSGGRGIEAQGYDDDPARAILAAALRALIADTEGR